MAAKVGAALGEHRGERVAEERHQHGGVGAPGASMAAASSG